MNMQRLTSTLIFIFGFSLMANAGGGKLRYDLEEGTQYRIVSTFHQKMFRSPKMENKVMDMNLSLNMDFEVLESSDASFKLEVTLLDINLVQKMGQTEMTYNSKTDSTGPMAQQMQQRFGEVLNNPVKVTINERGEVTERPAEDPTIQGQKFSDMIEEALLQFPKEKVKKGATWNETKDAPMMQNVSVSTEFEVEKYSRKEVIIKTSDDIQPKSDTTAMDNLTMKSGGTITLNPKTGWLIKATTNQTLEMTSPQMGEIFAIIKTERITK